MRRALAALFARPLSPTPPSERPCGRVGGATELGQLYAAGGVAALRGSLLSMYRAHGWNATRVAAEYRTSYRTLMYYVDLVTEADEKAGASPTLREQIRANRGDRRGQGPQPKARPAPVAPPAPPSSTPAEAVTGLFARPRR